MKLKFKHQRFQADAARSVTDIFKGQPYCESADFLVDQGKGGKLIPLTGFGNRELQLDSEALTENVRQIQMGWGLKPVEQLEGEAGNPTFTIEMETGTGKTYTYIKTMYELNKLYGWSKFVIIVPSIAIREGVSKSFETMQEHFAEEYGKRIQFFVYNSRQLTKIDGFASDSGLHVMIINTQAFNTSFDEAQAKKKSGGDSARIIFSRRDEFGSRRPIDILAQTRPIMIIDEPQSVLGSNKGNATRKGIALFRPLFTLLYSATHRKGDIYNMVYRLDAMDAFNRKLVKKIEVKAIEQIGTTATGGFVYLEEIVIRQGLAPQARLTYDVKTSTGFRQATRLADEGYDLFAQSGGLTEYAGQFVVERIDGLAGTVHFLNGLTLHEGDACGKANEDLIRRLQIRETIRTHIERERKLFSQGIKVLSLFFIGHVSSYRVYGKGGEAGNGKFAEMFEEEYRYVLQEMQPRLTEGDYSRYLSRFAVSEVHQGYFAQDKGRAVDTSGKSQATQEKEARAYNLIMRDKERLLSFDEPVRFIFSHSALKEGWDNPNVFQICTLKDTANEIKKRQEVGRGMRLCVNKDGERQDQDVLGDDIFDTNILTVIASESYESFSRHLQEDLAESVGDRPRNVTPDLFEGMHIVTAEGQEIRVNMEMAREIDEALICGGYIKKGQLTDKYFDDKKAGTISLGEELEPLKDEIVRKLDTVFNPDSLKPGNARKVREGHFRRDLFKEKFAGLWKRIRPQTCYQVAFSTEELIKRCIKAIDEHLSVTEIRIVMGQGSLGKIENKEALEGGTAMVGGKKTRLSEGEAIGSVKYDLIGKLVEATGLTRKTIVEILKGIKEGTFYQFKKNPEEFIIRVGNLINDAKAIAVVQQIVYKKTTQQYETDIFTENTLRGVIGENAIESTKSLYDIVVVDSQGIEKHFTEALEQETDVEVYAKLPRKFYINTPMGHYNPDWAIVFKEGSVKHIYFIAETKGNDWQDSQLRGAEAAKIACARRHFAALNDSQIAYGVAKDYQTLYNLVTK